MTNLHRLSRFQRCVSDRAIFNELGRSGARVAILRILSWVMIELGDVVWFASAMRRALDVYRSQVLRTIAAKSFNRRVIEHPDRAGVAEVAAVKAYVRP